MAEDGAKLDDWFAGDRHWPEVVAALRAILHDTDLTECWKWRQPCYAAHGGNIAIIWDMTEECGLGFFKGVLLDDREGVLVAPGENSRSARKMCFRSADEVDAQKETIRTYLSEAMANEKAGKRVEFEKDDIEPPEELDDAFADDADYREAFKALTPGRQRGWLLHFTDAAQSKTRTSRIAKAREKIMDGKGRNDR